MKSTRLLPVLAAVALLATACSKSDHATHDHDKKSAHSAHVHVAPHGGTLVEIGDHAYNVDLLLDAATGTLHGWLLNAHAKGVTDVAKTTMKSFEAIVTVQGKKETLVFRAVPPADGSAFDAQADWLKTVTEFDGIFPRLVIDGETFNGTAFNFPKGGTKP